MPRRFFRHGELPLVLLALLSERPMHGYEIMADLSRLFGPAYRPSPGSVYPAVDALEAEGLIAGRTAAGRTTFATTAGGDRALAERAENLATLELRTGVHVRRSESLEPELARFAARLAPLSGRVDREAAAAVLDRAAAEIELIGDVNGRGRR